MASVVPSPPAKRGSLNESPAKRESIVSVDTVDLQPKSFWSSFKSVVYKISNAKVFTYTMLVATVWALFAQDLYLIASPHTSAAVNTQAIKNGDGAVYGISAACFILFWPELIFNCIAKPGYFWNPKACGFGFFSFFCTLDALAAFSLAGEFLWVVVNFNLFGGGDPSALTLARAGRAARAGTRAARVVRILKLLTLLRKRKVAPEEEEKEELKPSKIGEVLGLRITQKVICIVAVMLIATTLLDMMSDGNEELYSTTVLNLGVLVAQSGSCRASSELEKAVLAGYSCQGSLCGTTSCNTTVADQFATAYMDFRAKHNKLPVVLLSVKVRDTAGTETTDTAGTETTVVYVDKLSTVYLREFPPPGETKSAAVPTGGSGWQIVTKAGASYQVQASMKIDDSTSLKDQALVNFLQVTVVIIVLAMSSMLFSKDSRELVVHPLEKMTELVRRLSSNPLAQIDESEGSGMETDFVEAALKKFGKLLQIAFGEAGADVIAKNLSVGGELNPMLPGKRIEAIYGFCLIRNFTDCTECLQEDIMVFVNRIAEYVHYAVHDHLGAPNKNIGDVFLLVWKLANKDPERAGKLADGALKSAIRSICEVLACPELDEFAQNKLLQQRIPGFRVRLAVGFNVGWAIEGAIGSKLKIDASYLSPNVNMSSRMEAATGQFGCDILISEFVYTLMSDGVKSRLRRLDRLTVKGSKVPVSVFTFDCPNGLSLEVQKEFNDSLNADPTKDFFTLYAPARDETYRKRFSEGIDAYLGGTWDNPGDGSSADWEKAKVCLEGCLKDDPSDTPAKVILDVMQKHNFVKPGDWRGFRSLTSK